MSIPNAGDITAKQRLKRRATGALMAAELGSSTFLRIMPAAWGGPRMLIDEKILSLPDVPPSREAAARGT